MMTMSKDIKDVTRVNLIKNISPRRPTRGTTNLALQFPSCPLDATPTLRDGAHSISGRAGGSSENKCFGRLPSLRSLLNPHLVHGGARVLRSAWSNRLHVLSLAYLT
jgi:hypothetical protein